MAYTEITSAEVAAGEAVKQELFTKVKDDLIDHESRMITTEAAIGRLPPIEFAVLGEIAAPFALDGVLHYRVEQDLTITAARLFIVTAGSAGSAVIDVEYKRGAGAWTSILSATISAAFGTGSLSVTTGVLTFQAMLAGDLLRLNVDSVQTNMKDFSVYLENESA